MDDGLRSHQSLSNLKNIREAAKELGISCGFLYRLPRSTPGLYLLGRSIRIDIAQLKEWARSAAGNAGEKA